jgi:hypothetical protein
MGWRRTDRELAATRYAGRESATDKATRKQRERGSMGKPHRNAADADRTGWTWWDRHR